MNGSRANRPIWEIYVEKRFSSEFSASLPLDLMFSVCKGCDKAAFRVASPFFADWTILMAKLFLCRLFSANVCLDTRNVAMAAAKPTKMLFSLRTVKNYGKTSNWNREFSLTRCILISNWDEDENKKYKRKTSLKTLLRFF